jgi:hypothetical protein
MRHWAAGDFCTHTLTMTLECPLAVDGLTHTFSDWRLSRWDFRQAEVSRRRQRPGA